jgi:hypothetical protein
LVLYAGVLASLFVLRYRLNVLMVSTALVNAVMVLPTFLLHPEVVTAEGVIFPKKAETRE